MGSLRGDAQKSVHRLAAGCRLAASETEEIHLKEWEQFYKIWKQRMGASKCVHQQADAFCSCGILFFLFFSPVFSIVLGG